jgi:hypothetical protein
VKNLARRAGLPHWKVASHPKDCFLWAVRYVPPVYWDDRPGDLWECPSNSVRAREKVSKMWEDWFFSLLGHSHLQRPFGPTVTEDIMIFEDGKYYVAYKSCYWDGPFDDLLEAVEFMKEVCGDYTDPEIIKNTRLVKLVGSYLMDVRDDSNECVNCMFIYLKKTIWMNKVPIWPGD